MPHQLFLDLFQPMASKVTSGIKFARSLPSLSPMAMAFIALLLFMSLIAPTVASYKYQITVGECAFINFLLVHRLVTLSLRIPEIFFFKFDFHFKRKYSPSLLTNDAFEMNCVLLLCYFCYYTFGVYFCCVRNKIQTRE